jgi:hypothetical protein
MKGKKNNVNWKDSKTDVLKTQQKILIAYNNSDYLDVDKLQNKLVCSFAARARRSRVRGNFHARF